MPYIKLNYESSGREMWILFFFDKSDFCWKDVIVFTTSFYLSKASKIFRLFEWIFHYFYFGRKSIVFVLSISVSNYGSRRDFFF